MYQLPAQRRCLLLSLLFSLPLLACEKPPSAPPLEQAQEFAVPPAEHNRNEGALAQPGSGIGALPTGARSAYEQNSVEVFKALAPSVVFVTNKQIRRDAWSRRTAEVKAGSGTGFVWDKSGHIVTNYHVINKGTAFEVTLYDGTTLPATFVGGDPTKDLAVLKVDTRKPLKPVALPRPNQTVDVGQKAVAIGNPFGFDHTLTVGVVSAIGRAMPGFGGIEIRDMLQTDAAINPGNSGGPLLDSEGRLIGVNTMISSKSGSSAGVGFAVPVSAVRRSVPDIIRYGEVKRAGLGIKLVEDVVAKANGVKGIVIAEVQRGTPAAKAGLRGLRKRRGEMFLGDVIVAIGRYPVLDYDQLHNALARFQVGDNVNITIMRDDEEKRIPLKLMQLK
ncbi:MAG: trypsin-like serine protease [Myxococcales bacterium]|nr:trypsin-like serine protease [Myxococcales bacterium]